MLQWGKRSASANTAPTPSTGTGVPGAAGGPPQSAAAGGVGAAGLGAGMNPGVPGASQDPKGAGSGGGGGDWEPFGAPGAGARRTRDGYGASPSGGWPTLGKDMPRAGSFPGGPGSAGGGRSSGAGGVGLGESKGVGPTGVAAGKGGKGGGATQGGGATALHLADDIGELHALQVMVVECTLSGDLESDELARANHRYTDTPSVSLFMVRSEHHSLVTVRHTRGILAPCGKGREAGEQTACLLQCTGFLATTGSPTLTISLPLCVSTSEPSSLSCSQSLVDLCTDKAAAVGGAVDMIVSNVLRTLSTQGLPRGTGPEESWDSAFTAHCYCQVRTVLCTPVGVPSHPPKSMSPENPCTPSCGICL